MKWILKKLIVVLVQVLVVMGLVDALGIDIEGLLGGLLGEEGTTGAEETTGTEETTEA
ncbi:MAG: hypothetical protein IKL47_06695 [Clostridia bacterium]|nr:hypothetical protein [Clostridia bacterium]